MTDSPRQSVRSEEEGFLSRWSRRKLSQDPPAVVPAAIQTPEPAATGVQTQADVRPDQSAAPQAPLTDADMPALETLADDSDYSGFLSPQVSGELRRLALRRMFRSRQYQTPCNLIEYGGNYTNFLPLGDTVTADMRHRLAQEALRRAAEGLDEEATVQAGAVVAGEPDSNEFADAIPENEQPSASQDRQENI